VSAWHDTVIYEFIPSSYLVLDLDMRCELPIHYFEQPFRELVVALCMSLRVHAPVYMIDLFHEFLEERDTDFLFDYQ
jgi:hypothetical protein